MKLSAWYQMAAFALLLALPGCTQTSSNEPSSVSPDKADALNAEHARFDQTEDPAFTAQTHYAAGQLAENQKAYSAAIRQYEAALQIDPHHLPTLQRLGVVYAQLRAYPQAIAAWQRYVKETNGDAAAYANLGFCYELAGQQSDAQAAYKQGLTKDPTNPACRINFGLMLARADQVNEAIEQLQAVLPPARVHYNLASVYEQQGKREQAKAEYRKALELDPNLSDARTRLQALQLP